MARNNGWAVFFDAVDTLIHPHPDVLTVYYRVGQAFGSTYTRDLIKRRFRDAWEYHEQIDFAQSWRTDEKREETRWRRIVAYTLPDVSSPEDCFLSLYDHFSRPDAWQLDPEVVPVLRKLAEDGYQLGICSNFDQRLRSIVAGMPELNMMKHLIISSEVGWRKPAKEFFQRTQACVGLDPSRIFMVGDNYKNDYEGASRANFQPIYFSDNNWNVENQIAGWGGLIEVMQSIIERFR